MACANILIGQLEVLRHVQLLFLQQALRSPQSELKGISDSGDPPEQWRMFWRGCHRNASKALLEKHKTGREKELPPVVQLLCDF